MKPFFQKLAAYALLASCFVIGFAALDALKSGHLVGATLAAFISIAALEGATAIYPQPKPRPGRRYGE